MFSVRLFHNFALRQYFFHIKKPPKKRVNTIMSFRPTTNKGTRKRPKGAPSSNGKANIQQNNTSGLFRGSIPFPFSTPWAAVQTNRTNNDKKRQERTPSSSHHDATAGRPEGTKRPVKRWGRRRQDKRSKIQITQKKLLQDKLPLLSHMQPETNAHDGLSDPAIEESTILPNDSTEAASSKRKVSVGNLLKKSWKRVKQRRSTARRLSTELDLHQIQSNGNHRASIKSATNRTMKHNSQIDIQQLKGEQLPPIIETKADRPADLLSGITGELQPWEPPKPRKRRPKKPKHGDDSLLIGMIIRFDPSVELLEMGTEPQCIKRTKLQELQMADDHSGNLLGSTPDDVESQTSHSNCDLLEFSRENFVHSEITTHSQQNLSVPSPIQKRTERDMAVGFGGKVTKQGKDSSDNMEFSMEVDNPSNLVGHDNANDEIEIIFYHIDEVVPHVPQNDEDVQEKMDQEEGDSRSSEDSNFPLHWLLPSDVEISPGRNEIVVTEGSDPPEYEWFLPAHLDIPAVNYHSPRYLFGERNLKDTKKSQCTPSTIAETEMSFELQFQASFDGSPGSSKEDLLSLGSLPSDAVKSLVDFCQSSATRSETSESSSFGDLLYDDKGYLPRDIAGMMNVISRGIDF